MIEEPYRDSGSVEKIPKVLPRHGTITVMLGLQMVRNPHPRAMTRQAADRETSRVPPDLGPLFWDCDLTALDVERHREQILERVLQDGNLDAVRWMLRTYGDDAVSRFILEQGSRRLDPKILSFWRNYYDLGEPPCTTRSSLIASERGWRY